ncbi:MAG: tetratricopeptide repeat protein [Curvibacter sp.]|jgi:predicted O-linked N-acetylglucosamine transferase (SPINDLY family)|nr:tetratricopeptide repeat protein [Curvibacter sp.]
MTMAAAVHAVNTAHAATEAGNFDAAIWWARHALEFAPGMTEAWYNLGRALAGRGRPEDLVEAQCAMALAEKNGAASAQAQNAIGLVFHQIRCDTDAERCFLRSIELAPGRPEAYSNLGRLRATQKRFQDAESAFRKALELAPASGAVLVNLSRVLCPQNKFDEAIAICQRATELLPGHPQTWLNLVDVLLMRRHVQAASLSLERAEALAPQSPEVWDYRGQIELLLKNHDLADQAFSRSLELDPKRVAARNRRLALRQLVCRWETLEQDVAALTTEVTDLTDAPLPFLILASNDDPALQRRFTERYADEHAPAPSERLGPPPRPVRRERIRIAYSSGDFRAHPVSYLMAGVLEQHNRQRFELIALSEGPADVDAMSRRVSNCFDEFIDVTGLSSKAIAQLARDRRVDIAIDLAGHTDRGRFGAFAYRLAPVQASYLGYLGTMGMPAYDYIIADSFIIPPAQRSHYTEHVACLPFFQANDNRRQMANCVFHRDEFGIAPDAVVYASFNNSYKITPQVFDIWMRVLKQVPQSVLMLYVPFDDVGVNLQREAMDRGVSQDRIVLVGKLPHEKYLARFRVADLMLDTLLYNAGTTASDALWAGLPVLTCPGHSFASRMGGSILHAAGLSDLVASDFAEYERLAVELGRDPAQLKRLRERLDSQHGRSVLFDAAAFTTSLEQLYVRMHERSLEGLPPDHLDTAHVSGWTLG